MTTAARTVEKITEQDYKYGFVTDVDSDTIPKGLNEDVVDSSRTKKVSRSGYSTGGSKPVSYTHLTLPTILLV